MASRSSGAKKPEGTFGYLIINHPPLSWPDSPPGFASDGSGIQISGLTRTSLSYPFALKVWNVQTAFFSSCDASSRVCGFTHSAQANLRSHARPVPSTSDAVSSIGAQLLMG
jgi:hypothetical protein